MNEEIFPEENEGIILEKNGWSFYKNKESEKIWSAERIDVDEHGPYYFSFDTETVFNFWTDYTDKLTPEQIEIFKKENPTMAELK